MKTKTNVAYIALLFFGLAQLTHAQCPQICDDNDNVALGAVALVNDTTGFDNTAIGVAAIYSNTTGSFNTAVGISALQNSFGDGNTALGSFTLSTNTTGSYNTALGYGAMWNDFVELTGSFNTATGVGAMQLDGTGSNNTANGVNTLGLNTAGSNNTAVGFQAMMGDQTHFNATGSNNTGIGYEALFNYTTGSNNTATGYQALFSNTTGLDNAAQGYQALYNNTTGNYNMADGQGTLYSNTTGRNNTADGQQALGRNTTGSNNIALGSNAGSLLTTGNNNIDIFHRGVAGEGNTIRIGQQGTQTTTFIAGVSGATVPTGVAVIVDATGHLGTITSSARFKEAIEPMDKASEAILELKPMTFRYKRELDPDGIPQFGLVAEQVEKVNPALVSRDDEGKVYTVRYEAVNAMLLNEFLKEHKKVEEQQATIAELKSTVAEQQKGFQSGLAKQQRQIEALTAGLQKVSAQVGMSHSALQTVVDNH